MSVKPLPAILLLIVIISIPLFAHLDAIPMQLWDESRLADQAMEMIHSHNWIVTTYQGQPDMWMTKPPLMIWLQVVSLQLIGYNELAIRLPSALAGMATCLLLFYAFAKKIKAPMIGFIAAVVLVTIPGYIALHGTRTGEYDAVLTFFTTAYAVFFFLYIEEHKPKYIYATFIFLTAAVLTKSIQGLVFLPALFIYAIYKKRAVAILKDKGTYIGIALFLFFVVGFYLLREHYNPGYVKAVIFNEVNGRYNTVIESHSGDEWFYYDRIVGTYFCYWYLLLIPGAITGILNKQQQIRDFTILTVLLVAIYFLVINNSQTKIDWYMIPMYPFLAIIIGIFLYSVCRFLASIEVWKSFMIFNPFPYILLFLVLFRPYQQITRTVLANKEDVFTTKDCASMELFLKDALEHKRNVDSCIFLDEYFNQNFYWYYQVFDAQRRGVKLARKRSDIPENGKIILYRPEAKEYVEHTYNTQALETFNNVTIYKLNGIYFLPFSL